MNSGGRLGLYAAGLVVAFAAVYAIAAAVVPDRVVADWSDGAPDEHAAPDDHAAAEDDGAHESSVAVALPGVSLSAHGYVLSSVSAPTFLGEAGELSFQIADEQGEPLMAYQNSHEKDLHLIVVRTDGSEYRHVHPTLDEHTGLWSTPWSWVAAGSYRMYADFVPAVDDGPGKVTLTRTIDVAGAVVLASPTETTTVAEVDGYEVSIEGSMVAGSAAELTLSVSRAGVPVTVLEPYLGAFGHLVALRGGDLAYLHVHAEGKEPKPGDTAGPEVTFFAEAPTAGRYLLYLDFKVDGVVRTAQFTLDATQRS